MRVGCYSALISPIDRSCRQNLNRETLELKDILNQMDVTDNYIIEYVNKHKTIYFLLLTTCTLSKFDYIIKYKYQQVYENQHNTLHPTWPTQMKVGNIKHQKQQIDYKHMKTEQLSSEPNMSKRN